MPRKAATQWVKSTDKSFKDRKWLQRQSKGGSSVAEEGTEWSTLQTPDFHLSLTFIYRRVASTDILRVAVSFDIFHILYGNTVEIFLPITSTTYPVTIFSSKCSYQEMAAEVATANTE